jgi:hypothetical protein
MFEVRYLLENTNSFTSVSASVLGPYVSANLRTPAKVDQAVTAQSTIYPNGTYVEPFSVEIDGLILTPSKTGLLKETQRKFELLHFGYAAQWGAFRGVVVSKQLFADTTTLPYQGIFFTSSTAAHSGLVWMLVKGYIN